ncbi:MAG: ribose-5-phosphate isomerase A, partial [Armatimonadota bacterium]|nr:ribose-5-phosphate isomerase A [Armatimonadota bacterium]
PFAWQWTQRRLERGFGVPAPRRVLPTGDPFLNDDGLYILDMAFGAPLPSPDTLEARLKSVAGVVETGLFVGLCQRLIIGYADGHVEERTPDEGKA